MIKKIEFSDDGVHCKVTTNTGVHDNVTLAIVSISQGCREVGVEEGGFVLREPDGKYSLSLQVSWEERK